MLGHSTSCQTVLLVPYSMAHPLLSTLLAFRSPLLLPTRSTEPPETLAFSVSAQQFLTDKLPSLFKARRVTSESTAKPTQLVTSEDNSNPSHVSMLCSLLSLVARSSPEFPLPTTEPLNLESSLAPTSTPNSYYRSIPTQPANSTPFTNGPSQETFKKKPSEEPPSHWSPFKAFASTSTFF